MEPSTSEPSGESTVISSPHNEFIDTCSLVLSSKNIKHQIQQGNNGSIEIIVSPHLVERARYQLSRFLEENKNWPPPRIVASHTSFPSRLPTIAVIGSLAFFFMITGPWRPGAIWFEAGANDANAILDGGQWYRLITSLTLHADVSHLAGNCLVGAILIYYFLQINGVGFGLLAILLAGSTGNLVNILAHGQDHLSVGFSTAIFSIIGMLSMYQVVEQRQPFGIRFFVPFMAGAGLLAMLGSSGGRTDLGSHLFGLLTGLIVGLLIAVNPVRQLRHSSFMQIFCFILTVCSLLISWNSAFMAIIE